MSRKPVEPRSDAEDNLTETRALIRASEAERKEAYAQFQRTIVDLTPMEKAKAWLSFIAEHREADGDLESLVFLASRGQDVTPQAMQLINEWKTQEKEAFADYNAAHPQRPAITANEIAGTSRVNFRDFWGGRDEQQLTIDATMLRAVEWCQIGGFEHVSKGHDGGCASRLWVSKVWAFRLPSGHFCPTLEFVRGNEFVRRIQDLGEERGVEVRWVAHRGKGSHGLLYYGSNMTTVRNLKDEVDKRA